jgi:hypothetical protein
MLARETRVHGGMAIDVSYQQTLFIHKQQTSSLDKATRTRESSISICSTRSTEALAGSTV